ncbi:hypothetical protein J1N35_010420 [Gossypium stocksii]|uniref:Uncharacterized protein n=1 Tax=Gossypium stocksii TaxID=47602 RepID=A0A9D3W133_9ROSI|nr:hypothetical protein J1N35_010420 [Gossypium stocksii]
MVAWNWEFRRGGKRRRLRGFLTLDPNSESSSEAGSPIERQALYISRLDLKSHFCKSTSTIQMSTVSVEASQSESLAARPMVSSGLCQHQKLESNLNRT